MDNDTLIATRIKKDESMKRFIEGLTKEDMFNLTELMSRARIEALKELKKEFAIPE